MTSHCVYVCMCCLKPGELESIVGERVSALRKLKNNPHDKEALGTIFKVQQQVSLCSEYMLHHLSGCINDLHNGCGIFISV